MTKTILGLFIAVLGFSAVADTEYIDATNVNFRSEPGVWGSQVYYTLKRDSKLTVIGRHGNWLHVIDARGNRGWIYKKYATDQAPSSSIASSPAAPKAKSLKTASVDPTEPSKVAPAPTPTPKAAATPPATVAPAAPASAPPAQASVPPASEPVAKDQGRLSAQPSNAAPPAAAPASAPANTSSAPTASSAPSSTAPPASACPGLKAAKLPLPGIPQSACFGDSRDPVAVIYLHGHFAASGRTDGSNCGFRQLEFNNRIALEEYAKKNHVRVAAPVATGVSGEGYAEWNGPQTETEKQKHVYHASLKDIESAAKNACNVSSLPRRRKIIGFSSGAFEANNLICRSDNATRDELAENYSDVVAIGTKKKAYCDDGLLTNISPHVFPPENQNLQALLGGSPTQTAQADRTTTAGE